MSDTNSPVEQLGAEDLNFEDFERMRSGESEAPAAEAEEAEEQPAETEPASEPEDSDEEEEEGEEEPPKDGQPKKKGGYQRRIDKLTRKTRELEAALEALKQPSPATEKPAAEKPPEPATDKPKVDDFETFEDFTEALTDWKLAEAEARKVAEAKRAEVSKHQTAQVEQWQKSVAEVKKTYTDFDAVIKKVDDIAIPDDMQALLLGSECGPLLAYTLAKDRNEVKRIAALPPLQMARELGRIEAKLTPTSTSKPKSQPTTAAPKPVTPVSGGTGKTVVDLADPDIEYEIWERRREAQLMQRSRR